MQALRRAALLTLCGAFTLACDAGSGDLVAAGSDVSVSSPEPDEGTPIEAPPESNDLPVATTAAPEILPSISDGGIVYMRPKIDSSALPEPVEGEEPFQPNCVACPWCAYCSWDIVHYDVGTGMSKVIDNENQPRSAPRIQGHRIVWTDNGPGQTRIKVYDLGTGVLKEVQPEGSPWLDATPELRGATLYWNGYLPSAGNSGLIAADVETGAAELLSIANMYLPYLDAQGAIGQFGNAQPFALSDTHAVWAQWNGGGGYALMAFDLGGGEAATLLAEDETLSFAAPCASESAIAWKAWTTAEGCSQNGCDLSLHGFVNGGEPTPMSPDARPTQYARLAVTGTRMLWLDYREGPYTIYARDIADSDSSDERVVSDDAVLTAKAAIAVYGQHVAWMDLRDGNWDIYRTRL